MRRFLTMLLLACPALALAQVIPDRTSLNSIVGAGGVSVNFESLTNIGSGSAFNGSGITQLNSGTIVNGLGPNLVPAGVTFVFPNGGNLQWDDAGYYSAPSREILTNVSNTIEIHFTTAARAFGLDLRAFNGYTETITATVYAADTTTVLSTIPNLNPGSLGNPIFFGYQSASGIGRVVFSQTPNTWSPMIDNLTFTVIPEPPPYILLGGGLVLVAMARRHIRRRERDDR